jgi:hypothetical protein
MTTTIPTQFVLRSDTKANINAATNSSFTVGQSGTGPGAGVEIIVETDSGFGRTGYGVPPASTGYWAVHPEMALADNATAPNGVLSIPAGSGTALVIPNIPTYAQVVAAGLLLPSGFVIQHAGVFQSLNTSRIPGATYTAGQWTTLGAAPAGSALVVNPTAITAGTSGSPAALTVGEQTPVTTSTLPVYVALPAASPANAGLFIAVEKADAAVWPSNYPVYVTGPIRASASSTITLRGGHQVIGFVADGSGYWWPAWSHTPASVNDNKYAMGPGAVTVAVGSSVAGGGSTLNTVTTAMYGRRYIVNEDTVLSVGSTLAYQYVASAGATIHAAVAIYDTGEGAGAGTRTLLGYSSISGTTAEIYPGAAANSWISISLATIVSGTTITLYAGQHVELIYQCDTAGQTMGADPSVGSAVWTFVIGSSVVGNSTGVGMGYACAGGAKPYLAYTLTVTTTTLQTFPSVLYEPGYTGSTTGATAIVPGSNKPLMIAGAF